MPETPAKTDHAQPDRALRPALMRGFACRCPACGKAGLFARFLKTVPRCPACGQDWSHHQADDLPAYIVILVLGHLLVPVVVEVNSAFDVALVAQMILWPVLAGILALALLQPVKGAVVGLQWSRRMHGFAERTDETG